MAQVLFFLDFLMDQFLYFYLFFHQFFSLNLLCNANTQTPLFLISYSLCNKSIYYIDMSVLLENIPLVKLIKTTSGTRVVYFP